MASVKIDTLETVKTKIDDNLNNLGETLSIVSDSLRSKKFDVPDGNLCKSMLLMGRNMIGAESIGLNFLTTTKPLWDDLFSVEPSQVKHDHIEKIKAHLPQQFSPIINPLLDCRNPDGSVAIDTRLMTTLLGYLKAFVKLGLKIVFFKQVPTSVVLKDDIYYYEFTNNSFERSLDINLSLELHKRQVVGIPRNI